MSSQLPLENITIIVTRAADQSSQFTFLLQQQGAKVIEVPALEIGPPSTWQPLDAAITELDNFDWLILTSANGVDSFYHRLVKSQKTSQDLGGLKIAVVGKKTAATLEKYSLKADFIPPNYIADALISNFPEEIAGKKILFPRVETGGREVLVKELTAAGAKIIEVAAYESGCPQKIDPEAWLTLQRNEVHIITFASSKTVQNFHTLIQKENPQFTLTGIAIGSIGPQTSKTCQELFGRVDIEAGEYTLEGLTAALINWVNKK
ncbi:MAG: hypothetical protein N5P05_003382 [Chroococcopsis gigantea SAG 12.99]|jgi:uroporphyrinogen III methyltransferase/synthase|nr:hypothetical protein [Chroococcopsis gigantea SAG 12.99]